MQRTSFKSQRLAGDEHDIGAFIAALHFVMTLGAAVLLPAGAGREVQARGFVRGAADVPRAYDAVAVGNGKIE